MVYSIDIKKLYKIFSMMHLIRATEERIVAEYPKQEIRCPTHLSIGQEAVPSVLSLFLDKKDLCVSTHRAHAHYIAKGGSLNDFVAELYGKSFGCSKGKGGSMHLIDTKAGFMGSSAIVGNSIPVGLGLGYKFKNKKTKNISVVFLGDGATEEGVFYESLNFAAVKSIPTLFVCENNQYSVYSSLKVRQPDRRKIYKLAQSIGVKSLYCDGNNIDQIYKSFDNAIKYIKKFKKPYFLEFSNYRWREHCGPNYDDDLNYRNKKITNTMISKDPLIKMKNFLSKKINGGMLKIQRIEKNNYVSIDNAFTKARRSEKNIKSQAYKNEYYKQI